ncbi:MAG: energy transducer TonB [Polyangiales bacterium]
MPQPPRALLPHLSTPKAAFASVVVHLWLILGASLLARHAPHTFVESPKSQLPVPVADEPLVVELPAALDEPALESPRGAASLAIAPQPPSVTPPSPSPAMGAIVPRVDTRTRGRAGDDVTPVAARNLAPRADDRTTSELPRDSLDRDQDDRTADGRARSSPSDRAASSGATELTFVSMGHGFRYERRPMAPRDVPLGVPDTTTLAAGIAISGRPRTERDDDAMAVPIAPAARVGAESSSVRGARYGVHVASTSVVGATTARARGASDRKRTARATADDRGETHDPIDGDPSVDKALRSLVSTSTAGGTERADGQGGASGAAGSGIGGREGSGASGQALGLADGTADGTRDPLSIAFHAALDRRLEQLLQDTFPHDALFDLRSGTVIVEITVSHAGEIVRAIVVRPSGFLDFDQNVVDRLRGAREIPKPPRALLAEGEPSGLVLRVPVFGGWRVE